MNIKVWTKFSKQFEWKFESKWYWKFTVENLKVGVYVKW